jgi:hypothetical protein
MLYRCGWSSSRGTCRMSQDGSDLTDVLFVHMAFLRWMSREFSRLPDVPMSRRRFPGGCLYVSGLGDVQIVHSDVLTDVQSFSRLPNVPDVQVMFCRWMSQASPDWWMSKASALISVTDVPTVSSLTNVPSVHFCFSCRMSQQKDVSRFRRFRC